MPLTLEQKKDLVERYRDGVGASPHVYLVDYKGISVPAVTELRAQVRQLGGEYRVIKNRLMLRAIGGEALEVLSDHLTGSSPYTTAVGPENWSPRSSSAAPPIARSISRFLTTRYSPPSWRTCCRSSVTCGTEMPL